MDQNNIIIYVLTIVICVFVIIIYSKNRRRLTNEPLVMSKLNKPNVRIENSTQYFYIHLLKI